MFNAIKQYWQYLVMGALVLVVIGMGAFGGGAKVPQATTPVPAVATPTAPAATTPAAPAQVAAPAATPCPPAFESCTPKKTDAQLVSEAIDRLGSRLATQSGSAPAAPTPAQPATADPRSPFIAAAPAGHHFVGATKGRDGASCEARGGKIVPDTSKPAIKTGKGLAYPNKCTADA